MCIILYFIYSCDFGQRYGTVAACEQHSAKGLTSSFFKPTIAICNDPFDRTGKLFEPKSCCPKLLRLGFPCYAKLAFARLPIWNNISDWFI